MNKRVKTSIAAERLGVAEVTLKNSRITGKLGHRPAPPYYKIGRSVEYDPQQLDEYIEECRVVPSFDLTEATA